MSLKLSAAALRTYDALKARPGAAKRRSDARDASVLDAVNRRLSEMVASYTIVGHDGPGGATYVFWSDVDRHIQSGAFDDLLRGL